MTSQCTCDPASDIGSEDEHCDHHPPLLVLRQPFEQLPIESQEARLHLHIHRVSMTTLGQSIQVMRRNWPLEFASRSEKYIVVFEEGSLRTHTPQS